MSRALRDVLQSAPQRCLCGKQMYWWTRPDLDAYTIECCGVRADIGAATLLVMRSDEVGELVQFILRRRDNEWRRVTRMRLAAWGGMGPTYDWALVSAQFLPTSPHLLRIDVKENPSPAVTPVRGAHTIEDQRPG